MKIQAWGPVVALLAMVAMALAASVISKPEIYNQTQPTQSENQNCVSTKLGSEHGCSSGVGHKGQHWYDTFRDRPTDWLLVLFNFLLVIVTAALVISTNKLWDAGERQLKQSEKASQQELRAYVLVSTGHIRLHASQGGQGAYTVRVDLKNFGQTPGYEYSTWIGGGVFNFNDLPFPAPTPFSERKAKSIIGPKDTFAIQCASTPITWADLRDVGAEKKAIFIWGGANYTDIFGKNRYVIFRIRVSGADVPIGKDEHGHEIRGWPLKPHPLGYEAD